MHMKKIFTLIILGAVMSTSQVHAALPQVSETAEFNSTIERIHPAVVTILIYKQTSSGHRRKNIGAGSGFAFTYDGYILTNKHVVDTKDGQYTVLLSNGIEKNTNVVYRDPVNDVAILKVEEPFKTIAFFGNSSELKVGQSIASIGNALNANGKLESSTAQGTVSAFNKTVVAKGNEGTRKLTGLMETTAHIIEGYSGGPLIDRDGKVMGINVAKNLNVTNSSFIIPIDSVKESVRTFFNTP